MFSKCIKNIGSSIYAFLARVGLTIDLDKDERNKIFWLAVTFFCVIGSYTVLKEMKDILFSQIVGSSNLWKAKLIAMPVMFFATLMYAKLVDYMSRFRLLCFYSTVYVVGGFVISYFLSDPVIGIANEVASPDRWFGWFIYLFYEGVVAFVVSVFWAFANSVTEPKTAKKGYTLLIAGSKLGGMVTAGVAYLMFKPDSVFSRFDMSSVFIHQFLLSAASVMLACSPVIIYFLLQSSSQESLHGYKAVHEAEMKKEKEGKDKTGAFAGLCMIMKHPYIMGIFGMMFFYELVNVVLGIQRTMILQGAAKTAAAFSGEMFGQRFLMHFMGLCISFLGTRVLIKRLGEKVCLVLIPVFMGIFLAYFMVAYNPHAVMVVFMAIGMLNYSFASPLREALYIPTVKDVRYKSKSWIESFGQRFAKTCGSSVAGYVQYIAAPGSVLYLGLYSSFFAVVVVLWIAVAWLLGKKYEQVVENKEAIGAE